MSTNEGLDTQQAIAGEIEAVNGAIGHLEEPLLAYANEVKADVRGTGGDVTGLDGVIQSLLNAVNGLLTSLGLGSINAHITGVIGNAQGGTTGGLLGGGGGLLSGGGLLGTGINLKRQVPDLIQEIASAVETLLTKLLGTSAPSGLIQEVVSAVEALLTDLLGGVTLPTAVPVVPKRQAPTPSKRQLPDLADLPIALPTLPISGLPLPSDLIQEIVSAVEALLTKLLGGTGLSVRQLPDLTDLPLVGDLPVVGPLIDGLLGDLPLSDLPISVRRDLPKPKREERYYDDPTIDIPIPGLADVVADIENDAGGLTAIVDANVHK
jgi:hypothetical protein